MRAAVIRAFGAPKECIKVVTNWEIPKIEQAEQVLIKVVASGCNPVDTYIRSGNYGQLPSLPYVPGRDGAGVVEEVGMEVKDLKKGDRVWFLSENGSAAEYALSTRVFPLPDEISFAEGAGLGIPYLTAYRALFKRHPLRPNSSILVHGASGGVGLAACQLAAWNGHSVVGTAGTAAGCDNVRKNGAKSVYNHREEGYVEAMKKGHPGEHPVPWFDLILEMAAHLNLANDMGLLARNGAIAVVGNRGEITINPRLLMTVESSIYGVALSYSTKDEYQEMAGKVNEMLASSKYRPVIQKEYALEELPQAHIDIIGSSGALGNLVISI